MSHNNRQASSSHTTSTHKGLSIVSRLIWPLIGVLWIAYGIRQLIVDYSNIVAYINMGTGLITAVIPLTKMVCSQCRASTPFAQVWEDIGRHDHFTCAMCNTRHRLPLWSNLLFYGFGVIIMVPLMTSFYYGWPTRDYFPTRFAEGLFWAQVLWILLIRFSLIEQPATDTA